MLNQTDSSASETSDPTDSPPSSEDFVWSFRGYKLCAGDFTTAMVHFFRAEVQRANVWRQRLDTTTYWAVVTTGAAISVIVIPAQEVLGFGFLPLQEDETGFGRN